MSADIRLVKLRRRAINNSRELTQYALDSDGNNALSMDYFDIISVKKFASSDLLEDIMDVGDIGLESRDDVSMQSYSLYCDEETLLKHEKDLSYGDPFLRLDSDTLMPFLSIIQVHITPEVLARVPCESGSECLSMFFDDLHSVMDKFVNEREDSDGKLLYRIYQSLSAGDFAVIIRSTFPETSFYVSSLLRKRTVKKQKSTYFPLVLYKTYTILSIYSDSKEAGRHGWSNGNENRLVIRCCFANKYWSEKDKIDKELAGIWDPKSVKSLRSLNGRYDFTVELTESEFEKILPVIGQYKGFSGYTMQTVVDQMNGKKEKGQLFETIDYLCYLITNGYLSYVNERYLLRTDPIVDLPYSESGIEVVPFVEGDHFLSYVNEKKYLELEAEADQLKLRITRINAYQKNRNYYFGLLQKLLHLCQTINGLSDTRIYACMLLWQIECVLDGIDEYITVMERNGDSGILVGLEDFLRKSVCALDSFARYIRNNNLQSLQTPNYSLQSSASMEKLLLGYGALLEELIEGYRQSSFAEKIGKISGGFRPVLIPALQDGQLSIEVMFSDVYLFRQSQRNKLMVVKCSTLQELTDITDMVAACFHEIAHQFRYESRKQRNRVLVHYVSHAAFWPLVKEVSKELCREVTGLNEESEIENVLLHAANKAFTKAWETYLKEDGHAQFEEQSLLIFQLYLEDMMCYLWDNDDAWDSWLICRKAFLEDLKPKENSSRILNLVDPAVQEAIKILKYTDDMYSETQNDFGRYLNKVKNAACYLWKKVHLDTVQEENAYDWEQMNAKDNIQNCRIAGKTEEIDLHSFELFLNACMQLETTDRQQALIRTIREDFLKNFYTEAVKEWNQYIGYPRLRGGGRYLGLDEESEENRKGFSRMIQSKMFDMKEMVSSNINDAIDIYREETSDIYMYTMLNLTPFGYLNFMAHNIPAVLGMDIDKEDALRILGVLLAVWNGDGAESEEKRMFLCFSSVFEEICRNLKHLLDYNEGKLEKVQVSQLRALLVEQPEYRSEWQYEMCCRLAWISEECLNLRADINAEEKNMSDELVFKELLHYQYLCNILYDLIDLYLGDALEQSGYYRVSEDLRYGFREWQVLRLEMEQKNCWKYCMKVGDMLNAPYLRYQEERNRMMDWNISFLQEMYYQNKIGYGRQMLFHKEDEVGSI